MSWMIRRPVPMATPFRAPATSLRGMKPISDMERGETLALERISEELELDADMMRFLDENHIRPDARISLVQKDPYGGITVEVRDRPVGISVFASERLFVAID